MSVIIHEASGRGITIGYSSGRGLTLAIEDSPIVSEGQAESAAVAMLSIDNFKDQDWIQVDSPRGQSDLVTIERTIALLTEVRDALGITAATE